MGSLFNQFYNSIETNFRPNMNKHSYKKQNHTKVLIASYSYRRNLFEFAGVLSKFLKENYKIKNIKDIKPEMVEHFFQTLIDKNRSKYTIIQYKSYIRTLDKLIKQTYYFKAHLSDNINNIQGGSEKVREVYMKPEHYDLLVNSLMDKNSSVFLRCNDS